MNIESVLKKISFNKREKILFIVSIITILIGFFRFWYTRIDRKYKADLSAIDKLKTEVNKKNEFVTKLSSKNKLLLDKMARERIQKVVTPFKSYINDQKKLPQLVQEFSPNYPGQYFRINKLSLEEMERIGDIEKSLFSLDIESSFLLLGKFLDHLENSKMLTTIKSTEIIRFSNDLKKCFSHIEVYGYTKI